MFDSSAPIGIFDSGIGGMTVASAVTRLLPNENTIYFGDTAHLPYGDKSTASIQAYSIKICNMLLQQNCKLILIACNSASAAAFELVREYVGSKAKVLNVIDPVVDYIKEHYDGKTVGLIGTKQTVLSNVYKKKVDALDKNIHLKSLATPLLAPMIEEGFFDNNISESIIDSYLSDPALEGIEALILGCTHYPLIKNQICKYYENDVEILDTSEIVAHSLRAWLEQHYLVNEKGTGKRQFYVSDYTLSFEQSTNIFFGQKIQLEHYPLWE
ncbi:glutamate racemase [Dyadobacter frigoris]|uniref:Glutamate racemase n=1 Tax=Dyadobacter frigoris TaxID=2576211 RepID=A0A4U6D9Z1_9BACT|nr:glutamate racemase [Dyadobacter frigoris]TKT91074.1 glutamate racemase [Dyadobacter frigoris]GLU54999.1 glutamate racemase [Dyadobacter frigoris]